MKKIITVIIVALMTAVSMTAFADYEVDRTMSLSSDILIPAAHCQLESFEQMINVNKTVTACDNCHTTGGKVEVGWQKL